MTIEAEFYRHLVDLSSVEYIALTGVPLEVLPTVELRPVFTYAMEYFYSSGRSRAVTMDALASYEVSVGRTLLHLLVDYEIGLDPPELSIADVIDKLKAAYVTKLFSQWQKDVAIKMASASTSERLGVAQEASVSLVRLVGALASRRTRVDLRESLPDRLEAYAARKNGAGTSRVSYMGLSEVDHYTGGLAEGEVGIVAGFAKAGKSFLSLLSALAEHRRGRTVVLFTLENSIPMTEDRIGCLAMKVDTARWDRGEVTEEEFDRIKGFVEHLQKSETPLWVLQPERADRSVEAMVRQAQALEADTVIIDQLSHIYHPSRSKQRNEVVREIMQDLVIAAQDPHYPLPIWVYAQISRGGKESADKRGWYNLDDLAESSEAERSATLGFSIYQSDEMFKVNRALLQVLFSRRVRPRWWDVDWYPGMGRLKVRNEHSLFTA